MKNYYLILGVNSDATLADIKAAYREQAKNLHPDYFGQDSGPFIDLQEAYAILSDAARRKAYDSIIDNIRLSKGSGEGSPELLVPRQATPEPLIPTEDPVDLGELSLTDSFCTFTPSFDELFDRLWRNFSLIQPKVERLRSLNVEIRINSYEAHRGGRVKLSVPARLRCPGCVGQGGIGLFECWQCAGTGVVQGEYPVTITFPPGVANNYVIQIPLDRFGIGNFYLNVIFRVSDE